MATDILRLLCGARSIHGLSAAEFVNESANGLGEPLIAGVTRCGESVPDAGPRLQGAALPANAGTVTQDLQFDFGARTGFAGAGTLAVADARTHGFKRFHPSLGMLTSARWELQSAWAPFGSANVESNSTDPHEPALGILLGLQIGIDTRINFAGSLAGTSGQYFSHGQQASQARSTTGALSPCLVQFEFGGTFDAILDAH